MSLDLHKLEKKLDEALSNETSETLTKFLNDKRMTNETQKTAVECFIEELEEKGKAYEENQVVRTINICIDVSDYMALKVQAKEMEKEQIIQAILTGFSNWDTELGSEQYYEQTYGGGEQ